MKLRNGSLSTFSAVAVVLGLAACGGGTRQSQANAPPPPQAAAPSNEYGAAMGQPYGAGPGQSEMPAMPGAQNPSNPPSGGAPGAYGNQGTAGGAPAPGAPPMGATESNPSSMMNQQPNMGGPGSSMGGTPGAAQAPGAMGSMQGSTSGMPGGMDVSGLDDAQLAAVLQAINMGEIQSAQLAETKASSADVKRYARQMGTQHRDMENRANAVFTRTQITPSDNAVSNQLKNDMQNEMSTLQTMRGKDFDREFMDGVIRDHNHALELLDRAIPNAKGAELKTELQNARTKVEAHLRQAEKIQQTLQKGATNKQGTGSESNTPKQGSGSDSNNPY